MTCGCGDCQPRTSRRNFLAGALISAGTVGFSLMQDHQANAASRSAINVASGLDIFPRSQWGADLQPKPGLRPEKSVKFLLVHHTAASNTYRNTQVVNQIQSIYRFHTGTKQWPDVCYNFFVDRFGGVWEGRAGSLNGSVEADATGGSQGFAQLVCLLGNFETARPPQVMIQSCSKVLGWLAVRNKIDVEQTKKVSFISRGSNKWKAGSTVAARPISGHRDMSATLCPGQYVYPQLEVEIPKLAKYYKTLYSQ